MWVGSGVRGQRGTSLGEQLLEEALLLGLAALSALLPGALLVAGGGGLVQVRFAAHQVHRALDVGKHLHLLHLGGGVAGKTWGQTSVADGTAALGGLNMQQTPESLLQFGFKSNPTTNFFNAFIFYFTFQS